MPNDVLIRVSKKVADEGAIAVGPFKVGRAYPVPSDAAAVLCGEDHGAKFETTKLEKDEQPATLGGMHLQHIADVRAFKDAADAAKAAAAKAEADAKAAAAEGATDAAPAAPATVAGNKSTPAAAGAVTGG